MVDERAVPIEANSEHDTEPAGGDGGGRGHDDPLPVPPHPPLVLHMVRAMLKEERALTSAEQVVAELMAAVLAEGQNDVALPAEPA